MPQSALWREPDFRKLWAAQAVSKLGSSVSSTALPLTAAIVLGASPLQMGYLSGAGGAAVLVFGLFAGAWADRLRRRPILIFADFGRAAVLGLVPLTAALHCLSMGSLYLIAAANGFLSIFFDASYQAYLPSLVSRENILQANAKLAMAESAADIAGPGLGGALVQLITAPMAVLIDAVSFLCSGIFLWLIRKREPRPEPQAQPDILREIRDGLQTAWRHPVLRALAMRAASASFFMGFFGSLYFVYAIRELGLSAVLLGTIISVGGATALLGAFVAERLARRFGVGPTLIGAALVSGFSSLLLPLARGPLAVSAAFLTVAQLFDVAWPVYNINEVSLRQAIAPERFLGRVNAAMHLLFQGIWPIGAMAGGAIAQGIGIRMTLLAGSTGFLLATLWLVFSPVRTLRELPGIAVSSAASAE